MAKVTGLVYISLDGTKLHSEKGAEIDVGGASKEAQMSVHGFVGHAVDEIKPGVITGTLIHTSDIDVVALQAWTGNALFETDSGQRYQVRNAAVTGTITLAGNRVKVTISGHPAQLV